MTGPDAGVTEGALSTEARTQRLFFALWPDPDLRAALAHLTRKRLRRGIGRVIPPDNLHITLLFLGDVPRDRRPCLDRAGAAVQAETFVLVLDRFGHFPRPRVLWLGPSRQPPALFRLVGALRDRLAPCELPLDARPYQAHMTLVRKCARPPRGLVVPQPLVWQVDHFALIESVSGPDGVHYRALARWPLRSADPAAG